MHSRILITGGNESSSSLSFSYLVPIYALITNEFQNREEGGWGKGDTPVAGRKNQVCPFTQCFFTLFHTETQAKIIGSWLVWLAKECLPPVAEKVPLLLAKAKLGISPEGFEAVAAGQLNSKLNEQSVNDDGLVAFPLLPRPFPFVSSPIYAALLPSFASCSAKSRGNAKCANTWLFWCSLGGPDKGQLAISISCCTAVNHGAKEVCCYVSYW